MVVGVRGMVARSGAGRPDVAPVGGLLGVLQGLLGHEPGDRLGDEPIELGGADAVGEARDLGVHEPRCLQTESEGGLGNPAGPPRRQATRFTSGVDSGLDPGQPVLQLQGVGDQHPPRVGGPSGGGGELRDRELRHRRGTLTSQGELTVGAGPGRGQRDRLRRVLPA